MKEDWVPIFGAVVTTFIASSGFWTYMIKRTEKRSATTKLLMGLAYDKISYLGMKHIRAGYIYGEDYDDFRRYLYEPYKELGGNGTAERIMNEVSHLPLRSLHAVDKEIDKRMVKDGTNSSTS